MAGHAGPADPVRRPAGAVYRHLDHLWLWDGTGTNAAPDSAASLSAGETVPDWPGAVELTEAQQNELELIDDPGIRKLTEQVLRRGAPDFVAGHEIDGVPIEAVWPEQHVGIKVDGAGIFGGYDIRPVDSWTVDTLLNSLTGDD